MVSLSDLTMVPHVIAHVIPHGSGVDIVDYGATE